MAQGVIIRSLSGFYTVSASGEQVMCKARGRFRHDGMTPLVGDRVTLSIDEKGNARVDEILPRRNRFIRPAVANIEQLVMFASAVNPVTDPFLIDRVCAIAELSDCEPIVCVNKCDLDSADDLMQIYSATLNMGIYYMTYVLKNANLLGVFSWAINIPMIIGLLFTPTLVAKWGGMYRLNLTGYTIGTLGRLGVVIAGYLGSVPLMLIGTAIAAMGMSPLQGDMNALIANCSEYTYLTSGKRVDGTMYSCTSLGTKLGGGIGTALAGWLLAFSGYVGGAAEQSASCMNMLHIMYLWMPMCFNLLITLILSRLNVEKANEELRAHG